MWWLIHRIREQARSHKDSVVSVAFRQFFFRFGLRPRRSRHQRLDHVINQGFAHHRQVMRSPGMAVGVFDEGSVFGE